MVERAHPELKHFRPGGYPHQALLHRYGRANELAAGKDVLDCPCGTGWGTSLLVDARNVVGVDVDEKAIEYARTHYDGIEFVQADMFNLELGKTFDLVICLEGIEHVQKAVAIGALQSFAGHLKDTGLLYVTAPVKEKGNNKFHLHHYDEDELKETVGQFFEIRSCETVPVSKHLSVTHCLAAKKLI